jgi:hypothetical protein
LVHEGTDLEPVPVSRFKTPYINSKWIVPVLFILTLVLLQSYYDGGLHSFFVSDKPGWEGIREKVPYMAFGIVFIVIAVLSFLHSYSLIPVLGFLCCSYLLCESGTSNWERFLVWLVVGLVVYFLYGRKKSKLNKI